jgi:hypothetical protein
MSTNAGPTYAQSAVLEVDLGALHPSGGRLSGRSRRELRVGGAASCRRAAWGRCRRPGQSMSMPRMTCRLRWAAGGTQPWHGRRSMWTPAFRKDCRRRGSPQVARVRAKMACSDVAPRGCHYTRNNALVGRTRVYDWSDGLVPDRIRVIKSHEPSESECVLRRTPRPMLFCESHWKGCRARETGVRR